MPLHAQWARTYGGGGDDIVHSIQQTSDGGYILAGCTNSFSAGKSDLWILKLSLAGEIEWQRTYGGSEDDVAYSVHQTSDGGYIIAGSTNSFGAGMSDFWILKLSSQGVITWQQSYGGSGDDVAHSIQQTSDGGYIVGGYTSSLTVGTTMFWVLKLSSQGIAEWQRSYGEGINDYLISIQQTSDGSYIAAGYTSSSTSGETTFCVLKLSSSGSIDWNCFYRGGGNDFLQSLQQTSDGGYIVTGYTNSFGLGDQDIWVLKLSSQGIIEWQQSYGGSGDDIAYSIEQASDGGYAIAGYTTSFARGETDSWVLKLSSTGALEWQQTYGGSANDYLSSIHKTSDGGYIAAGYTDSFTTGDQDLFVLKLSSTGAIDPSCELPGSSNASVLATNGSFTYISIIPQDTGANAQSPNLSSQESNATSSILCEAQVSISGTIKTAEGQEIEGVTITFSNEGGTATTNSQGYYSQIVKDGWSGTATPSSTCYTFSPASITYTNVTSDQINQDYTATILTYIISGTVRLASTSNPLSGVVMNGLPGNPVTNASGYYEATVDCGWTGTVTPTRVRYVFSPVKISYSNVTSNQTNQDYSAFPGWIISGAVKTAGANAIEDVIITFSNEGGSARTDSSGNYSQTVKEGWSGKATPYKSGYTFSPSSRDYTNVTSDYSNQDYTGQIILYTLTISSGSGGTTQPSPGNYSYDFGTEVSIKAVPESGHNFSQWSGDAPPGHERDNPVKVIVYSNLSIKANFEGKGLCFIATAAYGSPLHPYLRILQDFKDKYLVPSRLGHALVNFYYAHSPSLANLISRHKALKLVVRLSLLPLIAFSYSVLRFGPVTTAVVLVTILLFLFFLVRNYRRRLRANQKNKAHLKRKKA